MTEKFAAQLVFLTLILLPLCVSAQVWLPDRDTREGSGIRVGETLILHPGAVVEGGWDSNPLRSPDNPEGAGRLRLSSYMDLATRKDDRRVEDENVSEKTLPKIDFRFGLAGFYDFYFSKVKAVKDQNDFGIDSHLNFVLFPGGRYSLLLNVLYVRTIEPYESREEMHARDFVKPSVGIQVRPGGGNLMISAKYGAGLLIYEDSAVAATRNKIEHDVNAEISWKMLPKTAFVSLVRFSPITYLGNSNFNNNSMPLRAMCGVRGLLTYRFGLSLFAGYGAGFYPTGDEYDGVIANGELMFFITPLANIRIGGQRDFVDSYYANFYVKNGGYIKYEQMFAKVFLLTLKADVSYRGYSTLSGNYRNMVPTDIHREEVWVGATLMLEYRATGWLSVIGSAVYKGNYSDFVYANGNEVRFHEFEGLLGLRAHY